VVIEASLASGRGQFTPVDVQVRWDDHGVTMILTGELDCASAPALTARFAEVLAKRPQRLVLDLANLTFMDCAGITPIARARRALGPGRPVMLRSPAPAGPPAPEDHPHRSAVHDRRRLAAAPTGVAVLARYAGQAALGGQCLLRCQR
jgi:anti-anti-sigma factor